MSRYKYVLHPGPTENVGYVSSRRLAELYQVPLSECLIDITGSTIGMNTDMMIHLWPREDGEYRRDKTNE